jgi:hypothetical protein
MQSFSFVSKKFRKISATLFYFLTALMLILLTGCPADPFCVTPINTQASRLTVAFAEGKSCERPKSNIYEVYVYLKDRKKGLLPVIWNIKSTSTKGTELGQIVYSIVPEGFIQTVAARPIRPGQKISFSAMNGYTGKSVEITLTK